MKEISKFFDKFRSVAVKELKKRETLCVIIYKFTKQNIDIKDITIKNSIISIKGSQGLKSEIFLKKSKILEQILKETNIKIVDIK